MLKGHVFKNQIFGNQIFALFIDTFLDGECGVVGTYKEKMSITHSGTNLVISSGVVCVKGRFLEEDTSTTLNTGTDNAYCKLVVELDLSKEIIDTEFKQATYKILKNGNAYPNLIQTDIVANNMGIYQFELAQFKTSISGITEFKDSRKFLDFSSIYNKVNEDTQTIIRQIQQELQNVQDGSAYVLKNNYAILTGTVTLNDGTGTKDVNYPVGFNKDNCIPISCGASIVNNFFDYTHCQSTMLIGSRLLEDKIQIKIGNYGGLGSAGDKPFKLVLMKL